MESSSRKLARTTAVALIEHLAPQNMDGAAATALAAATVTLSLLDVADAIRELAAKS